MYLFENSHYLSFKTVEQLLEEQQDEQSEESRSPVVFTDHTGKQVKARSMDAGFGLSRVDRSARGFAVCVLSRLNSSSFIIWSY